MISRQLLNLVIASVDRGAPTSATRLLYPCTSVGPRLFWNWFILCGCGGLGVTVAHMHGSRTGKVAAPATKKDLVP